MQLTPELIYGFSGSLLAKKFDNPQPTPEFHFKLWELCLTNDKYVAIAAPRGHAKSTAVTHTLTLAHICFRTKKHIMIISDTEEQAKLFLSDIKSELNENEDLKSLFEIVSPTKETETDYIGKYKDGGWFRIFVKGSGQKLRGSKYRATRPDLIICDDIENDESVENPERRTKFRKWFFGALTPCLGDKGQIRIVGTILHFDSLLERLLRNKKWKSARYAAHNADFSHILWPEKWPKSRLIHERDMMIEEGTPELYSQEYLNWPIDESRSFFKKEWLIPITNSEASLNYYIGVDLAISEKQRADYSVFVVAGIDHRGVLKIVDVIRERMDGLDIINTLFSLHQKYKPELFIIEHGQIKLTLGPILIQEQLKRGIFLNLPDKPFIPHKDKEARAKPLQARLRAGGVEINTKAHWYAAYVDELLKFPRTRHDDQVDATSWICQALDKVIEGKTVEEEQEDLYWEEHEEDFNLLESSRNGRSRFGGY